MNDRFMNGLISGSLAGIVSSFLNLFIINILHFGTLRYIDFAGILIYGRRPQGLAEDLFAFVGMVSFNSLLGIILSFLIPHISSKYFYIKAVTFGIMSWYSIYALSFLYQLPLLKRISLESSITNFTSAATWGIVYATSILWLKRREKELS